MYFGIQLKSSNYNMKKILIPFIVFISFNLHAQEDLNKLFIKCDRCDNNFLKNEITYVDLVREQGLADIQLFIYRNRNANNGNRYSLDFIGQNDFAGKELSLVLDTNPKLTSDEIRNKLKRKIDIGLVYFLVESDISNRINISYDSVVNNNSYESSSDKWKNWVFELSGSYNGDQEESRKTNRYEIEFEIDKLTEDWRIGAELRRNETNRKFYSDDNVYKSNRKTTSFNGRVVRSISNHFSAGVFFGAYQNTYENIDFNRYIQPAIEYSFYPYKDVLSKEITLAYKISTGKRNYIEKTIYGYEKQKLSSQTLSLNIRFRQKW